MLWPYFCPWCGARAQRVVGDGVPGAGPVAILNCDQCFLKGFVSQHSRRSDSSMMMTVAVGPRHIVNCSMFFFCPICGETLLTNSIGIADGLSSLYVHCTPCSRGGTGAMIWLGPVLMVSVILARRY